MHVLTAQRPSASSSAAAGSPRPTEAGAAAPGQPGRRASAPGLAGSRAAVHPRSGDRATGSQRGRSRRPRLPKGARSQRSGPAPSRARGFPRGDLRPPTAAARARPLLRAVLWPRGPPLGAARLLLDGISGSGRVGQSRPAGTRHPARVCSRLLAPASSVKGHLLRESDQSTDAGHEGTGTEFLTGVPRTHAKAEACTSTEGNVSLKSALAVGCKKC